MGMTSIQKKDSFEAMDMRMAVAVDEKYITRSYFKEEKNADLSIPSKRNSSKNSKNKLGRKLAEVFRTDFITAMKIPDSQQLPPGEHLMLKDTWRQEWEKGVQVPVNPEKLLNPISRKLDIDIPRDEVSFSMPEEFLQFDQQKYIASIDRSNTSCNYDLDDVDVRWLKNMSSIRTLKKTTDVDELTMERAITFFERQCFEKMAHAVATKEGLSIEYDESTTCNVCLSPDAEDGNEIIFCDACMMCAHQHCYGVLEIPEGTWLCNPCSRGILSPPCCLCPNKGGAMKRIKDSYEWIHVICAWWVPEVKIEDVRYIERITKDKIPPSRWNLSCSVCREKIGACVQCSVKRCVRAYHITCAVKEGLEMKTVVIPEKNDVQHMSFCSKHCTPVPPDQNPNRSKCGEDIENNRLKELRKLESEFYTLVSIKKASRELKISKEACRRLLSYWTMKRRANDNAPLIQLTLEQQEKLSGKQGVVFINQQKTLEMERFLHLRQDLERLRNLCYMIVRREKVRKELHRTSMEIFYKQNDILLDKNEDFSGDQMDFIRHRTTRFSCFSEHYQTEDQYEAEHGTRLALFDETLEEDDLLNSSQFEVVPLKDIEKRVSDTPHDLKLKGKNGITKTESERNIFELLVPKNEESLPQMQSSPKNTVVEHSSSEVKAMSTATRRLTETYDIAPRQSIHSSSKVNSLDTEVAPLPNGFVENGIEDETNKLDDKTKTSRLVKKGKKRFRNLHKFDQAQRRNSPRLNKIENETTCEINIETANSIDGIDKQLSEIISEAKRRRLNSSGDYVTEFEEEPPDYVRVTRSRVASYS